MFPLLKKYKCIFIIILILIILAVILFCRYYNKPTPQDSLSFEVTDIVSLEKLTATILLLVPTTGQFYVGDTINVALLVNTLNQPVNAVEGKIIFPSDKLEVVSISKKDSIISLWAEEPVLPSNKGSIAFAGGLPSPGFIGVAGKIITVSFKVKSEGDAVIGLEDAQVLANDGFATNILTEIIPTQITLLELENKREVADINEDGLVNLVDISILLSSWGISRDKRVDLDGDGKVGIKDLSILLSKWTFQ